MTPEDGLDSTVLLPQGPSYSMSTPDLPRERGKSKGCVHACVGCTGDPWTAGLTFVLPGWLLFSLIVSFCWHPQGANK